MPGIGADHAHHAFAADDAAVLANATNGTTYFHCCLTLLSGRISMYYIKNVIYFARGKFNIRMLKCGNVTISQFLLPSDFFLPIPNSFKAARKSAGNGA